MKYSTVAYSLSEIDIGTIQWAVQPNFDEEGKFCNKKQNNFLRGKSSTKKKKKKKGFYSI